jgi:ribose 5-phosphate isomerase B
MTTNMIIAIGSDHAATDLKRIIIEFLKERHCEVEDLGTHGKDSVDYPDFGRAVALAVSEGRADRGVLICGTGIGMSIVANKLPGIRATLCYDIFTSKMSRMHNDSNILVLGSRTTSEQLALSITDTWLKTEFEGGRHQNRLDKIINMEGSFCNGT